MYVNNFAICFFTFQNRRPLPRPRNYNRIAIPLLKILDQEGYVEIPEQSNTSDTATKVTKQCYEQWPPANLQHICWLAEVIGCKSLNDLDSQGWNIMHHLFNNVSVCALCSYICYNMDHARFPTLI